MRLWVVALLLLVAVTAVVAWLAVVADDVRMVAMAGGGVVMTTVANTAQRQAGQAAAVFTTTTTQTLTQTSSALTTITTTVTTTTTTTTTTAATQLQLRHRGGHNGRRRRAAVALSADAAEHASSAVAPAVRPVPRPRHSVTTSNRTGPTSSSVSTEQPRVRLGFCVAVHTRDMFMTLYTTLDLMYRADQHVFFIHADAKMSVNEVRELRQLASRVIEKHEGPRGLTLTPPPIEVVQQVDAQRFNFSLVEIDLLCLRALRARANPPDYFILISGDTMPLAPRASIESFLQRHAPTSFISHKCSLLNPGKIAASPHRCNEQHVNRLALFDDIFLTKCIRHRSLCRLELDARWKDDYDYIGIGWHWATLHRNFVEYMFTDELSHLSFWTEFFSSPANFYTPDEAFFQTLASMPGRPSTAPYISLQLMLNLFRPWYQCPFERTDEGHACELDYAALKTAFSPLLRQVHSSGVIVPFLWGRKFLEVPCYLDLYADADVCQLMPSKPTYTLAAPVW